LQQLTEPSLAKPPIDALQYDQAVAFAAGTDHAVIEAYNHALVALKQQGKRWLIGSHPTLLCLERVGGRGSSPI